MKRLRMNKQKVVKPDGRWMYLYTFEEEEEQAPSPPGQQPPQTEVPPEAESDCRAGET